jgi:hypothetical protein
MTELVWVFLTSPLDNRPLCNYICLVIALQIARSFDPFRDKIT